MKCITKYIGLVFLGLLLLACRDKQKPNREFAPDMYESAAYKTYATPPLTPPEHTVKRGSLPYAYPFFTKNVLNLLLKISVSFRILQSLL